MSYRFCVVCVFCVACETSSPALTPAPPVSNAPCGFGLAGPLATFAEDPRPIPTPTGGVIADGIYDLASLVGQCNEGMNGKPTGIRVSMRLSTQERSSNHQAGTAEVISGQALQTGKPACSRGRFAAFGTTFEGQTTKSEASAQGYSVTRDGFLIVTPDGGTCDPKVMVFRRRLQND